LRNIIYRLNYCLLVYILLAGDNLSMSDYDKYTYWIEGSDYDIETAKVMLKTKRYLYVGFMCHQSVEKALKGIFVRDYPPENLPYTHNLRKIAESAGIYGTLSVKQKKLVAQLEPLNIEARYPDERKKIFSLLSPEYSKYLTKQTEDFVKWLKTI
jgi:HEPN domain-containing protein